MYLVYGESFRLVEEEVNKIIKEDMVVVTMDLADVRLQDVLLEAQYVSMFQEKKILLVKNATFFASSKTKDEDIELLLQYMEKPVDLTTIVFILYDKIDGRKKITKAFSEKYKIISVGNLSFNDLMTKTRDYVFKNKYKIENETLQYILMCCQNNYDFIYNELNKIFLYYNEPQIIKMEDVKNIVSKTLEDNNFKFVEAVVNKDVKKILSILDDLYTLKVDPIALLLLLAREYRLMYSVVHLSELGYRKSALMKCLALQDWQIDKLLRTSASYYKSDLASYLISLAEMDYKIKKGEMDRFMALKNFLLEIL